MDKILELIEKYLIYIVIALFTIFTLPISPSPFIVPKEVLLLGGLSLVIVVWVIRMIISNSFSYNVGKFDLGVFLVALSYLLSTLIKTPNKMEAFLLPGTTTFVLGGAVLYFLINQLNKKDKIGVSWSLFTSSLLLSLSLLLTQLGVFTKIPQLPAFIKDVNFNPMGGALPSIMFLTGLLPLVINLLLKEKDLTKKIFLGVSSIVILFGLGLAVNSVFSDKSLTPKLVSFQNSWEVSVETVKKSPLWGIGPSNYLTAFNLFRPVSYNSTGLWPVRFTTARDFYLTALTEVGLVGLFAFFVLIFTICKLLIHEFKLGSKELVNFLGKFEVLVILILFALLPASPLLLIPLFTLLGLFSKSEEKVVLINLKGDRSRFTPFLIGTPILIGVGFLLFFGSKVILAEYKFKRSLDALSQNDAKKTYDLMRAAIVDNPKVDRYHASLAQIDMALASSIANKKDISDDDKKTVTQLVQQAIAEGKATVTLNPQRSGNWEVLARVYRTIMPFAEGADNFAIQSYSQAAALDPTNPNLRISLGGTYYALGRLDEAIDAFKFAVLAKPDLANAHYNLSAGYREKKEWDKAIAEMEIVLSLVAKNSDDYKLATDELANLEKNRPSKASTGSDNLTPPQPVGTSNVKLPITLPADSVPSTQ